MTGYVLASLIFLGGIITATVGELVNEEIRGWLDCLPQVILRLAASRLDPAGKITIYEDEWLPELACILRGAEARPISRLIIGVKFSAGLLITAKRIARHLHRTPTEPARSPLVLADATSPAGRLEILRTQAVEARLRVLAEYRADLAALMGTTKRQLDAAMASACDQDSRRRCAHAVRPACRLPSCRARGIATPG